MKLIFVICSVILLSLSGCHKGSFVLCLSANDTSSDYNIERIVLTSLTKERKSLFLEINSTRPGCFTFKHVKPGNYFGLLEIKRNNSILHHTISQISVKEKPDTFSAVLLVKPPTM